MKKLTKLISAMLAAVMLAAAFPPVTVSADDIILPEIPAGGDLLPAPSPDVPITNNSVMIGDIDGDKLQATPKDAMYLARYIAGWDGYADMINLDAADIDGDKTPATVRDAIILARYIAGWDEYEGLFKKSINYELLENEQKSTLSIETTLDNMFEEINDELSLNTFVNNASQYLENKIDEGEIKSYKFENEFIEIQLPSGIYYIYTLYGIDDCENTTKRKDIYRNNIENIASNSIRLNTSVPKRIITLQPYATDFDTTVFDTAAERITSLGIGYTFSSNYDNEMVDIEVLRNLDDYDIIILNGHGGYTTKNHSFIGTGIEYTNELNVLYNDDLRENRMIWLSGGHYAITSEFIDYYYDEGDFSNSLIYLGCCHGMDDDVLANTFISKGVSTVLGFSHSVSPLYDRNMAESFFEKLCEYSCCPVSTALSYAKKQNGNKDESKSHWYNLITFTYEETSERSELLVIGDSNYNLAHDMPLLKCHVIDSNEINKNIENAKITLYYESDLISYDKKDILFTDSRGNINSLLNFNPLFYYNYADIEAEGYEKKTISIDSSPLGLVTPSYNTNMKIYNLGEVKIEKAATVNNNYPLTGSVTDANGKLDNVEIKDSAGNILGYTENGNYSIEQTAISGTTLSLTFSKKGYKDQTKQIPLGDETNITVENVKLQYILYTISGKVIQEKENPDSPEIPLPGITVEAWDWLDQHIDINGNEEGLDIITDSNGYYEIKNFIIGTYKLKFKYNGIEETRSVTIDGSGNVTVETVQMNVEIDDDELTVSGIVVDENNNPIEGVSVYHMWGNRKETETTTDSDGRFSLPLEEYLYYNEAEKEYNILYFEKDSKIFTYVYSFEHKEIEIEDGVYQILDPEDIDIGIYQMTIPTKAGVCGDDLTWTLEESDWYTGKYILRISGTGDMYDFDDFKDVPWIKYHKVVDSIYISEGITHIGNYAFAFSEAEIMRFDDDVLGENALPKSLKSIGKYSFLRCRSISYYSLDIPDNVVFIDDYAFYKASLSRLSLGNSVEHIGKYAFYDIRTDGSELFVIPETVKYIGDYAFYDFNTGFGGNTVNGLGEELYSKGIYFAGDVPEFVGSCIFGYLTREENINYNPLKNGWDDENNSVKRDYREKIHLSPLNLEGKLGDNVFWKIDYEGNLTVYGTGEMNQIELGDFGVGPFTAYRKFVKTLVIEEGITEIGSSVFTPLENLTGSIKIPSSVKSIKQYAFSLNKNNNKVYFYGDAPEAEENCFEYSWIWGDELTVYHLADASGWPEPGEYWNNCLTEIFTP